MKWLYLQVNLQGIECKQERLVLNTSAAFKQSQILIKNEIFLQLIYVKNDLKRLLTIFINNFLSKKLQK